MSDKIGFLLICVAIFVLALILNAPDGSVIQNAHPKIILMLTAFTVIIALAGLVSSQRKFYRPLHGVNQWATLLAVCLAIIIVVQTLRETNQNEKNIVQTRKSENINQQENPRYWEIEIKAGRNGQFFTDAEVNGEQIYAIIDTGASLISLKWEDAEKTRVRPQYLNFDIPVSTANGTTYAAYAKLESVTIENITVYDVEALIAPKGAQDISLLGMSFLQKLHGFQVEGNTLTLTEKP